MQLLKEISSVHWVKRQPILSCSAQADNNRLEFAILLNSALAEVNTRVTFKSDAVH
jgi:hypothetical protein